MESSSARVLPLTPAKASSNSDRGKTGLSLHGALTGTQTNHVQVQPRRLPADSLGVAQHGVVTPLRTAMPLLLGLPVIQALVPCFVVERLLQAGLDVFQQVRLILFHGQHVLSPPGADP